LDKQNQLVLPQMTRQCLSGSSISKAAPKGGVQGWEGDFRAGRPVSSPAGCSPTVLAQDKQTRAGQPQHCILPVAQPSLDK